MSVNTEEQMLTELQGLLKKQIELAQHGNSTGGRIWVFGPQADSIVQKIVQANFFERPGSENQWKRLRELYDSLYLSLGSQKVEVVDKLGHVRKGRKIVGTYRNNIDLR